MNYDIYSSLHTTAITLDPTVRGRFTGLKSFSSF